MGHAEWNRFTKELGDGWIVAKTLKGYIKLTHSEAAYSLFALGTPSDWRCFLNTRAEMRRALRRGATAGTSRICTR